MIERRTVCDDVYQHLVREVLSGRLPPGTALVPSDLAIDLAVPRVTVREALWRLTSHGVVEKRGRAAIVRHFGPVQIRQLFQVRETLESHATELACGRMATSDFRRLDDLIVDIPPRDAAHHQEACHRLDLELHGLIARRCGNPLLQLEIDRMWGLVQVVRCRLAGETDTLASALRAHLAIIESLRDSHPANARRLMAEHIREAGEFAARWAVDATMSDAAYDADEPAKIVQRPGNILNITPQITGS